MVTVFSDASKLKFSILNFNTGLIRNFNVQVSLFSKSSNFPITFVSARLVFASFASTGEIMRRPVCCKLCVVDSVESTAWSFHRGEFV